MNGGRLPSGKDFGNDVNAALLGATRERMDLTSGEIECRGFSQTVHSGIHECVRREFVIKSLNVVDAKYHRVH